MVGDREKITVSRTLEIIKDKYKNEKDKEAITGEALGDVQDKFPGAITYGERVSKISKDIVILVDDNLNVTAYSEKSEDDGDDDSPTYEISESQYSKKGNYYYYEPDLSGFATDATYYVTYDENGNNETIYGRIDRVEKPTTGWYDYENKIWANVVTVNESNVTYWTYIPRYEYDTTGAHSTVNLADVKFISKTQTEADYSYTIPESFTFNSEPLAGFWVSKYEVQISEGSGIEQIQLGVTNKDLTVTTSNPSGTYTIYVNGEKTKTGVNLPYKISGLNSNKEYDVCVYSETSGRMIGSKKKSTIANNVIKVDLSGFNPDCTYYVTYDENGKNEQIGNKIKLDSNGNATNMPENWYNYDQKIWANIVTKGQDKDGKELITYWTYIPRYEYDAEGAYNIINFAGIKFIPSTQTEADSGYEIPESFTFGGQNLNGYWVSKYEVQGTID